MTRILAAIVGIAFLLTQATALGQGMARSVCGDRTEIIAVLERLYGETPTALGLARNGMAVELLSSHAGTWTILFTEPDGSACVIEYGQAWQVIETKVAEVCNDLVIFLINPKSAKAFHISSFLSSCFFSLFYPASTRCP